MLDNLLAVAVDKEEMNISYTTFPFEISIFYFVNN